MGYKKVDMEMVQNKSAWSTWYDVENGLVLHVLVVMKKIYVDKESVDPDGVPLMYFDPQLVTRVRKMTEQELHEALNETFKIELNLKEQEEKKDEGKSKGE